MMKQRADFFEKINKIDKPLANPTKRERDKNLKSIEVETENEKSSCIAQKPSESMGAILKTYTPKNCKT